MAKTGRTIDGQFGRFGAAGNASAQPPQLRALNKPEAAAVGAARLAQGAVLGFSRPIADSEGNIGAPYLALSTLAVMERNGSITPAQRRAGERFHEVFRLAALDGLKAADVGRVPGPGSAVASCGVSGNERCRRQIADAIRLLGGEGSVAASCAWHVLGLEWSLREWAAKALRCHRFAATGVVIGVLAVLEPDFGA